MKKILNINLSGRVIPIEDSAYEMLQTYIDSLRRYFANEEGRDEIINDIESRIAELMNELIRKGNSAVTDEDMTSIIASMGRVEDFVAADSEAQTESTGSASQGNQESSASYTQPRREKRLYRDSSDKILGGVCSGIANYLNVDPAVIRILFAILGFGGFGILFYIIMWIILPPRDLGGYLGKRLYRNPDDKIIGGVAGGLAAYFGRSATTIRLIFVAPVLLNIIARMLSWPVFHHHIVPNIVFGSLTSTFIFAYIVLWIILPEANSEYEKMEMRGEKVDINRIRQNVKEGMGNVKDRVKDWGREVKESAQQWGSRAKEYAGRSSAVASEMHESVRRTGRGFGHVIGVLFKAFFLFIAGTIAFGLFVALIGMLIGGVSIWPLKDYLLDGFWQNTYALGTLIFFLGIPLIGFIIWVLRRIMRVKSQRNYLGWTFGALWTLGWVCVILLCASLFNSFRFSNYRTTPTELGITQPVNNKMIVQVSEPGVEYSGSFPWLDIDGEGLDITSDTLRIANIKIADIEMSRDGEYHVEVKKYSRGRNVSDAEARASKIGFDAFYKDSVLDIGSNISIGRAEKFRGQEIIMLIQVPAGKKIRFDESVSKLRSFHMNFANSHHRVRRFDWEDEDWAFGYKTNTDYTMDSTGDLVEPNGSRVVVKLNNQPATDSMIQQDIDQDLQRQIDEEKQRREETDQKIRLLEEQKKHNKPSTFVPVKQSEKINGNMAIGPSTVSSLSQWF